MLLFRLILTMASFASDPRAGLVTMESKFYVLETSLPPVRAQFIGRLMDAAGQEYNRRFQHFRGSVRRKPRIKVFATREEYLEALRTFGSKGGILNTRGVFYSGDETVYTYDADDDGLENTLKHECFHQFTHFVVGGRLPAWAAEGLAEYFAEGVFEDRSGQLRLGAVPAWRVKGLQKASTDSSLMSIVELLHLDQRTWNDSIGSRGSVQYNQAWALCHFLVHANDGRYRPAFDAYLRHIDQGLDADSAFRRAFGEGTGELEKRYGAYIQSLKASGPQ